MESTYLLGGNNRGVGNEREVDTGVGHQVGLEFSQVYVEGAVKPQGSSDGGYDLKWGIQINVNLGYKYK